MLYLSSDPLRHTVACVHFEIQDPATTDAHCNVVRRNVLPV